MRKAVTAIFVLFTCVSIALSVQQPTGWITYTSAEGRYSVSLPATPDVKMQESTAASGEKFPQYLATVALADGSVYLIGYFDILAGGVFSVDTARDEMAKSFGGTLSDETPINLDGYAGRGFKISMKISDETTAGSAPVDYVDRVRVYEVEKRVYILQMLSPKALESEGQSAKITKYFDSFQLAKQ